MDVFYFNIPRTPSNEAMISTIIASTYENTRLINDDNDDVIDNNG